MKLALLFLYLCLIPFQLEAQNGNQKPRIIGQVPLSTKEDQSLAIDMLDLRVIDPDDWFYPWGFTMKIYPGDNYAVQGNVVIPEANFAGVLRVSVTVHDGVDESDVFPLEITVEPVNDRPVITGHTTNLTTREGEAITIQLSHLTVDDPDNNYPSGFTLRVMPGSRYRVNGNEITPTGQFTGMLSVNVRVNDGQLESETYGLPVEVKPIDRKPRIVAQANLQTPEDEPLTIGLGDLTVNDDDTPYPAGFTLQLSDGPHYTLDGTTVVPDSNYFGILTVPVRVNDGKNTSDSFDLRITVSPVNDPPMITLETEPLMLGGATAPVAISESITIEEVDGDSIMFVEVGFSSGSYRPNTDKLVFEGTDELIRAVFDANSGVLTILGQASPERYTHALRSVYYEILFPDASRETIVYFLANDGKSESLPVERILRFGAANVSLDIPTAFTPNGDAANDTWKIVPLQHQESYAEAIVRVYNRHGALVFETTGFEEEWDGRYKGELLPADTYYYTIDLKLNAPEGFVSGIVTILR